MDDGWMDQWMNNGSLTKWMYGCQCSYMDGWTDAA